MGALCGALYAPENFFHYLHKNITLKKSSVIIDYSEVSNNLEALTIFETLKNEGGVQIIWGGWDYPILSGECNF